MDWMNTFDPHVLEKRTKFTNRTSGPGGSASEDILTRTGLRVRHGHSTNPVLAGGIRRCSTYIRQSIVASGITPTLRRQWDGAVTEAWPLYTPGCEYFDFGAPNQGWSNMDNRSITEALLRLSSAKVQLANDVIEARKSFNMFCDLASTATKSLIALRRGRWGDLYATMRGPGSLPKRAADKWLEWIYGWKPLVSELHSAQELVKSHANTDKVVRVVKETKDKGSVLATGASGGYWWDLKNPGQLDYSSKVVLYARMSNKYTNMAKDWGIYNPASVAWEAVPYSFVVDWFLPVGNVIEAWSASDGYSFLTGCITRRVSGVINPDWITDTGHFYWNGPIIDSRSSGKFEFKSVQRQEYSDWPGPFLYTKSPFSNDHALAALALLGQVSKS